MREYLSYNICWDTLEGLEKGIISFVEHVENNPNELVSRLQVKYFVLDDTKG